MQPYTIRLWLIMLENCIKRGPFGRSGDHGVRGDLRCNFPAILIERWKYLLKE